MKIYIECELYGNIIAILLKWINVMSECTVINYIN